MSQDSENITFDETLENLQLLADISFDSTKGSNIIPPGTNPFRVENLRQNESTLKEIFGARCECGAERVSASSPSKGNLSAGHKHGAANFEHGIINPTPFKHKIKGEKKTLVRESILKNIGKCVHQNILKQNSIAKELVKNQRFANTFAPSVAQLKPSLSENNLVKGFNNDASDDMLDFRLLVDQCSELTLSTSSGSKTVENSNFSNSSFKALRQRDFTTNNSTRVPVTMTGVSRKTQRARQLKRCNSTSSLESDSSSNSGIGLCSSTGVSPQNPPQTNSHQSPSSSSPSSSASCSTQARLNSTMPCDITIDEMASYFETLVHIPKKMSSMAEMMYI